MVVFNGEAPRPETVQRMADATPYRGKPGLWHDTRAAVAQSASPIHGAETSVEPLVAGDLVVAADSRIDNREQLLAQLSPLPGQTDEPPSDAALILAAYRRWGTEMPERIIGDFAFVVWDSRKGRLFAARDPMGMRALYYRLEPGRCLFATELHQLLVVERVPADLNEGKVAAYLAGAEGSPDWSFFAGISQLAPAHALVAEGGRGRTWRFWDIDPTVTLEGVSERDQEENFREVFVEAVRCRLSGSQPVGILLSGGLDSGSVGSTAGWLHGHQGAAPGGIRTYSWAFSELVDGDEREASRYVAEQYGLSMTAVPADDAWPLSEYTGHSPHPDDPYFAVYQPVFDRALSAASADGVRRLLTGDRGDEMVGDWIFDYLSLLRTLRWDTMVRELRAHARVDGRSLRSVAGQYLISPLRSAAAGRTYSPARQARVELPRWVHPDLAKRTGLDEIVGNEGDDPRWGYPRNVRYGRIFSSAGVRMAVWADRTRAAYGIEHADPWSDRRVAETIMAMPPRAVQRGGERKRLIGRALAAYYPPKALEAAGRTEPHGLFERAFRDRARNTVLDLITGSRAAELGFVDAVAFRQAYEDYLSGRPVRHDFWWPITLEIWLRKHW